MCVCVCRVNAADSGAETCRIVAMVVCPCAVKRTAEDYKTKTASDEVGRQAR